MICSASRYLLVAWFTGLVVSGLTGSDGAGWAAAGVAVLVAYGLARRFPARFGGGACGLPAGSATTSGHEAPLEDPIAQRADQASGIEVRR